MLAPKYLSSSSILISRKLNATRFRVHDVQDSSERYPSVNVQERLYSYYKNPYVCSSSTDNILKKSSTHPLIESAILAFSGHHPLIISPDAVWLCILQGIAHHITLHSAELRSMLVEHTGKASLTIETESLSKDGWERTFPKFAEQIAQQVKSINVKPLLAPFSTTKAVEQTCFYVALMDSFQPFFDYEVLFICGIPSITLLGNSSDWSDLHGRLAALDTLGLSWWKEELDPLLLKFVEAVGGKVDIDHWAQIIKLEETYGSVYLDGWINKLIPYTINRLTNQVSQMNPIFAGEELTPSQLPDGLSRVPVRIDDINSNSKYAAKIVAGMAGVAQYQKTGALFVQFGWAVGEDDSLTTLLSFYGKRFVDPLPPEKFKDSSKFLLGSMFSSVSSYVFELYSYCNGLEIPILDEILRIVPIEEVTITAYDGKEFLTVSRKNSKSYGMGKFEDEYIHWIGVGVIGQRTLAIADEGQAVSFDPVDIEGTLIRHGEFLAYLNSLVGDD